ncbi:DNA (cytosine-5-)-methyltransferase, partial [Salmonella enterica subsp. enterica serovar Typhimurium]
MASLPAGLDLVTAGFPCTDLSQAGRTAGITGKASGMVGEAFRLLEKSTNTGKLPDLLIENVPNM